MKQWTIDGVFPSVTTQRASLSYFVTVSSADNAPGAPAERSLNERLPSFTYAITLSKKNRPGSDASAGSQAPLWNHSSELVPQVQCHHTFHSDGGSVKDPVHTRVSTFYGFILLLSQNRDRVRGRLDNVVSASGPVHDSVYLWQTKSCQVVKPTKHYNQFLINQNKSHYWF